MSNKNKNKNKKAKNKSNKFKRNLSLDVTYYTEEAYMKCFPDATLEDYCRSIISIDHSILQAEKMNNCNISNVRLVVIDEEYFEWIEENMLENSSENRILYINSREDTDVQRLWKKHGFDKNIHMDLLFVYFLKEDSCDNNNYPLSTKSISEIKRLLAKHYNVASEEIFMANKLIRVDHFVNEVQEEFEDTFFTGRNKPGKNFKVKNHYFKQDKSNLCVRVLPFATTTENNCILTRKEAFEYFKQFEKEEESIEDIANDLKNVIKKEFNPLNKHDLIDIIPFLIDFDDTVEAYDIFIESIESQLNEIVE